MKLSSANVFNQDKATILSSGKGLNTREIPYQQEKILVDLVRFLWTGFGVFQIKEKVSKLLVLDFTILN